jgi:hypothetical protein
VSNRAVLQHILESISSPAPTAGREQNALLCFSASPVTQAFSPFLPGRSSLTMLVAGDQPPVLLLPGQKPLWLEKRTYSQSVQTNCQASSSCMLFTHCSTQVLQGQVSWTAQQQATDQ